MEARRLLGGAAADIAHLASLFTVTLSDLGVASQAMRGVANGSVFEPPVLVFDGGPGLPQKACGSRQVEDDGSRHDHCHPAKVTNALQQGALAVGST